MKKAAHGDLIYWLLMPLFMNDRTAGDPRGDSHIFCHVHSANKRFFKIGKDQAFSALYDELLYP